MRLFELLIAVVGLRVNETLFLKGELTVSDYY
jgi:hypothetical protein